MRLPLAIFKHWRERRAVRRAFSRYLSPSTVDRLTRDTPRDMDLGIRRERRPVHFLLAQLHDDGAVATRLDQALALVARHRPAETAVFTEIMGSLLLIVFGQGPSLIGPENATGISLTEGQRILAGLSDSLLREIPGAIRVLSGETTAQIGLVGTHAAQIFHRALPDDFGHLLQQLMAQPFGSSLRVTALSNLENS